MTVRELMTKNIITTTADASVREAARLMYLNALTGLPVLDERDELVGIITEEDMVKLEGPLHIPSAVGILGSLLYLDNPLNGDEIEKQLAVLTATKVQELMTKEPMTIGPDEPLTALAEIFLHKKVNPVPVVKDKKLLGIVSRADIVKLLAGEKDLAKAQWKDLVKRN